MDSDMLASLILPTVKANLKTLVMVLIANIRSQLRYTPSYHKAWIAKQKVLEKIQYLETAPTYYNDQLFYGCQVFKRLFWSFKKYRDAFRYCKPLVQVDGTFMYGRYTHRLLLAGTGWWWENPSNCVCNNTGSNQRITGGQYCVHLRNRTWDYRTVDALRYPCTYVIAVCQNLRLDAISYVDKVYKLEYMYNV
ncbi:hypothetical protein J1N35_034021 [Gossypium stocksii]|uniref:Uncharacterized protein n=1 Tax=Gossypium stocksii TaxID=47602 RepID=A0A9D3ZNW9_9ROSI|nr:hypothetical protein J1N35_034021 [Gossypium stocksii]